MADADGLPLLNEEPCPYLPNRLSRYRAFMSEWVPPRLYHDLMDAGFRRSGEFFYQPACRACRACIQIRVPVAEFRPTKTQRRVWRRNQDLRVTVAEPSYSDEKFDLYRRYCAEWHGREDSDVDGFASFLCESPVDSVEMTYRDEAGRLLACGVCDVSARSLSSVYFYFDPEGAPRSLGVYGALWEMAWAAERGIPWHYMGYWIEECGAMAYKNAFRPYELLGTDGVWRRSG